MLSASFNNSDTVQDLSVSKFNNYLDYNNIINTMTLTSSRSFRSLQDQRKG